jgi:two-component system phosphate regulon sensor histidine kinase PhoR
MLAGGGCAMQWLSGTEVSFGGLRGIRLNRLAGMGSFLAASVVGVAGLIAMRRACRRLEASVGSASRTAFSHLSSPHPDLDGLVDSVNGIIDRAGGAVETAALRCKELEIQLKVAMAERQHAEAIIYSISDAVLVTDPFDEVVLANDSAARTFGFDLAAAGRAPIDRVLHDGKMVALIREMRQSDSRGGRRIVEHKVQTPAGERTYKVTMSCVGGQQAVGGRPLAAGSVDFQGPTASGVVSVLHDMTREKEVAELKNDFVSSVSHELRTPLASIKAYAEMLIDGEAADDHTRSEFYEVIQNEANRLGRLIDNILNISRIESGLVKVNRRPLSVMVLLKEATEVIAPQAKQKQIHVVEQIAPAFCQVLGDRDMLYESILNLLSNAVKYTPEQGQITVQTVVDESKKIVSVRVSDTGVGIPPKDLPFVFDKFYRCEGSSRMAKGTGLGLSLVKHIIETVHHGRLFVESQVGKGSAFGFELEMIE